MKVSHGIVDADAHVVEPPDLWERYMEPKWRQLAPRPIEQGRLTMQIGAERIPPGGTRYATSHGFSPLKAKRFANAATKQFSAASYIDAMNEEKIDLSVCFPILGLLVMGTNNADPALTTAAARAYNQWLHDFCNQGEGRLFGVGMLDMRDVGAACAEAVRCVEELGFVGFFVRPNPVLGRPWHDPVYEPIWSVIESLGVPVCFHEGSLVALPQIGPDRFEDRISMWHMCTHVMENQMAMVAMVLGGVLERHPRLRCGFMECGAGWLPYWMWRMDEHAETEYMSSDRIELSMRPSDYVRRQCYLSADSDEETSIYTMQCLNGANVVWATDYPHPDAKYPNAVKTVTSLPGIEQYARNVFWENPAAFYGERLRSATRKLDDARAWQRARATA